MLRIRSARLLAIATLVGLLATALTPGITSALSFSAKASVSPKIQYVGDSAGVTFTLKVKNTGTVQTIGAISVTRPSAFWTVTACPSAPAGWSMTQASDSCTYMSPAGATGNIARNHTATFAFTATTAPSVANRAGTWNVTISRLDDFSDPSWIKQAGVIAPYLNVNAYSFEVTDFVIADAAASVGAACPAPAKHAAPGATGKVVVVCGSNHTNATQTLKNSYAHLAGTFISGHGPFSSSAVAAGATDVVLGNWANVTIASGTGTRTVSGRVGAFSGRTSPPTLFSGYTFQEVAPVAVDDTSYSVNEDNPLSASSVLSNDTDANGDPLTAAKDTDPSHSQSFSFNTDGTFSYTPAANYHGTDTFTYHANDGSLDSNIATVTITVNSVNDAPIAVNDNGASYATNEDNSLVLAAPGVLGNDTDADGDTLTVLYVNDLLNWLINYPLPVTLTHGQLYMTSSGAFTYTPFPNDHGTDSFTYIAFDGTDISGDATVTITVNSVNDAPVAANDEVTTTQGAGFTYTEPNGLRTDVTDPDGDTQTISKVTDVSSGSVTVNADGSFSYTAPTVGDFSFTWKSNDGTVDSNIATMTIHVVAPGGGGGGGGGGGCLKVC